MTDRHNPRLRLAAAFLAAGFLLVGCGGSDGDDAADSGSPAAEANGSASGDGGTDAAGDGGTDATGDGGIVESIGGEDATAAIDAMGLDSKGSALVTATKADRYEVEGDTLHLYLNEDSRVPAGTECIIVGSVLSEDDLAVVHLADGTEVDCS